MAIPAPSFTGFPYGLGAPGSGMMAMSNLLALPQTATKDIFTVTGGPIKVLDLFGVVTTIVGAVANATKLQVVPTTAPTTAVDVCATSDINALAAGALAICVTSFATALSIGVVSGVGPVASSTLMTTFIMRPGVIRVNCAGSDGGTGRIQWFMRYIPMSVGVSQAGLVTVTTPLS